MDAEEGRLEVIDIDLNEEPSESALTYQEMLNDIENAYSRIEERIRLIEAVTMRATRRREVRIPVEVVNEDIRRVEVDELRGLDLNSSPEGRVDRLKRSDNHLLALVLESDGGVNDAAQVKKESGVAFFDCNICLGKAKDPILTCCGHLFCWPCFYLLPDVTPDTKECPECRGDVNESGIIPIYGNSDKAQKTVADKSGMTIPPRPRANRIESVRQQRITRRSHSTRIEEVFRSLYFFSTLSSAERLTEDPEGMTYLNQPLGRRYSGPDTNADTETGLPSSSSTSVAVNEVASTSNGTEADAVVELPRRISPRRIIYPREHFTDVTGPRSQRGRLRRMLGQRQLLEQHRTTSSSITEQQVHLPQQLSGVFQSEENPPDAPTLIEDPESSETLLLPSIRRRQYVLDTSEASGSGSPEPRRRRRLQ